MDVYKTRKAVCNESVLLLNPSRLTFFEDIIPSLQNMVLRVEYEALTYK